MSDIPEIKEGEAAETIEKKADAPAPEKTEKPAEAAARPATDRPARDQRPPYRGGRRPDSEPREGGGGDQYSRVPKFKRKVCGFCHDKNMKIDYKRPEVLERFITDRGKILPRRVTGTCSRHQRIVAREIKRARLIALVPFIEQ